MNGADAARRVPWLKRKPAKSGRADERFAAAEAIVDRLRAEYPAHASRDVERLAEAAAPMAGAAPVQQPLFGEIFRIAHDIRGQGAVFGYPLMSRLAGSLCLAMRTLGPHDAAMKAIIHSHVAGMRALLAHHVTGAGNRPALTIAAALEFMVRARTGR